MFHFVIAHSEHPGAATNKQINTQGRQRAWNRWMTRYNIDIFAKVTEYFAYGPQILAITTKQFLRCRRPYIDQLVMIFLYP